jgi:hypothetical protein
MCIGVLSGSLILLTAACETGATCFGVRIYLPKRRLGRAETTECGASKDQAPPLRGSEGWDPSRAAKWISPHLATCANNHCFALFLACLVREVIPIDVWREFKTREALGFLPFVITPRTHTSSREGIPHRSAAGKALPQAIGFGVPHALGAIDFWLEHLYPNR